MNINFEYDDCAGYLTTEGDRFFVFLDSQKNTIRINFSNQLAYEHFMKQVDSYKKIKL